jgi:hypothetical protein
MLFAVMTDPFAMSYPDTLAAAVETLQATLLCCWPRISNTPWQGEVTKTLILSWLVVIEDEARTPVTEEIINQLVKAAAMLVAILKAAEVDTSSMIDALVEKEPKLQGLFRSSGGLR